MNTAISPTASATSATAVRWSVSLHTTALLVQLAVMLLFLSGMPEGFLAHSKGAWLVLALGVVQLLAILACNPARGDRSYSATAVTIVVAEALEIALGRTGALFAHVTLAMVIWGFALTLQIRTITAAWAAR